MHHCANGWCSNTTQEQDSYCNKCYDTIVENDFLKSQEPSDEEIELEFIQTEDF